MPIVTEYEYDALLLKACKVINLLTLSEASLTLLAINTPGDHYKGNELNFLGSNSSMSTSILNKSYMVHVCMVFTFTIIVIYRVL